MTTTSNQHKNSFNDLAALLTGQIVLPNDADYEQVRQLWNGRVKIRPAAIARCLTVQDVIHTVCWTRSRGLTLSVRGAGNEIFGRSLRENGVTIDLSQMRAVIIDPVARTAQVQVGATADDLIEAAQQYGLVTPTGTVSFVGMAGLTFGGGYGALQQLIVLKREPFKRFTNQQDDLESSQRSHLKSRVLQRLLNSVSCLVCQEIAVLNRWFISDLLERHRNRFTITERSTIRI